MKYVIISKMATPTPIVFPEYLDHSTFKDFRVISGGFCKLVDGKVETYGESTTLHIKPDVNDAKFLQRFIFQNEM